MRHAFEGVSSSQKPANLTAVPRISATSKINPFHPTAPTQRPKPVSRTATARQADPKGKGKCKATQWDSDEDDDDDVYVTSNDFVGAPERKRSGVNEFVDVGGMMMRRFMGDEVSVTKKSGVRA